MVREVTFLDFKMSRVAPFQRGERRREGLLWRSIFSSTTEQKMVCVWCLPSPVTPFLSV